MGLDLSIGSWWGLQWIHNLRIAFHHNPPEATSLVKIRALSYLSRFLIGTISHRSIGAATATVEVDTLAVAYPEDSIS